MVGGILTPRFSLETNLFIWTKVVLIFYIALFYCFKSVGFRINIAVVLAYGAIVTMLILYFICNELIVLLIESSHNNRNI